MKGVYVIRNEGELVEFSDWDDIPIEFDALIRFEPEVPPPPHTDEQHEELERVHDKFKEIFSRER
jgi:hypothetical protein